MWTRNYSNLVNSALTISNEGVYGVSPHPYGDSYTGNYKNTLGNIYEICNTNTCVYLTRAPFIYRKYNSNGVSAPTAEVALLKNVQNILSGDAGHQKGKMFVAFGVSDDEETYEDYRLDDVISAFIQNSVNATVTENEDGTMTVDYHIILTATDTFTIREIGLFLPIGYYANTSSSNNYSYYALVNRMVLGTEISAAKDEVVHVNFSITTPKVSVRG